MNEMPSISFVIPMYNEAEVFRIFVDRMNSVVSKIDDKFEIILVDDGSSDDTPDMMEELATNTDHYHCIILSRNFGHQNALSAGLDFARGEYIMVLDADLQDPPEMFFAFKAKVEEGYDVVYGVRKSRKEGFFLRLAYNAFYNLLNRLSNYPIPKHAGDFALVTRRVLNAMNASREEGRFLRGIRSWVGFKQCGVDYERQERVAGSPKYTLWKLLKLGSDGVFNYTTIPVKLLTASGALCIGVSGIYFLVTLVRKYLYHDVPTGFTALLFVVILFGGFQLLSLGIIGEYIQRTFFQVKQRPLYIVKNRVVDKHKASE